MLMCYFLFCAHYAYYMQIIFAAMLADVCFHKHARKNYDMDALSDEIVRNLAIPFFDNNSK